MQLIQDSFEGDFLIQSYEAGQIKINNEIYERSVIVGKNKLINDWSPQTVTELTIAHLQPIIALQPKILLLGTGSTQKFLAPELFSFFYEKNIGVEVMTTSAACRTFTILISEGRNAVAALFL